MFSDYIPSKDEDLRAWANNFQTKLAAAPSTYGADSYAATDVTAAYTAFAAALTAATNPSTRTASTVQTKDDKRANLVTQLRKWSAVAQSFPAITPTNLQDLGLTVRDTTPAPVPAPSTQPVVSIEKYLPNQHQLRIVDSATPTSRAKPAGAKFAEVYVKRGTTPPASIADCTFAGPASRFLFSASHPPADAGKTAYYLTRWINAKGEPGPVSGLVSATIAA